MKYAVLLVMATSCSALSDNSWKLCDNMDGVPVTLDFDSMDMWASDLAFPLIACSPNPKVCFTGPMDFVDPQYADKLDKSTMPFTFEIKKSGNSYLVQIESKLASTQYVFQNNIKTLQRRSKRDGRVDKYVSC